MAFSAPELPPQAQAPLGSYLHIAVSQEQPLSRDRWRQLTDDGYELTGGWGLDATYGTLAVNLIFTKTA